MNGTSHRLELASRIDWPERNEPAPRSSIPAAPLPAGLALAERATALLRRYLDDNALSDHQIFFGDVGLFDIDFHLEALDEPGARWEPLPALTRDGLQPQAMATREHPAPTAQLLPPGVLWLRNAGVVVARWNIYSPEHGGWAALWLAAAASPQRILPLRERLVQLRRTGALRAWQIVTGEPWLDQHLPRQFGMTFNDLVLEPSLRDRLVTEIGSFFLPEVAKLHADLQVPYRRGVLLHGPPGNGKTSIIRVIGAMHPDVPAIVLRPGGDFGDGEFQGLIDNWREQAPAILVIEDLDWLLPRISVSTFLNRIDGLERNDAGMLMIATTNHPESLDPAINNRPGRFDVVLEVSSPSETLRLEYLQKSILGKQGDLSLEELAQKTDGLSFAHLREIINLSGLLAVREKCAARTRENVMAACEMVTRSHSSAAHGFTAEPDGSLNLAELHKKRRKK